MTPDIVTSAAYSGVRIEPGAQQQGLLSHLSDRRRVLAPDLPGHGDAAGPFTLTNAVERVHTAINEADDAAHVVGISGGAVVALLTYLEHPPRVSSLVLSGGLAHAPRWFAVQRALAWITPEPLLTRMLRGTYAGGRPELANAAADDFRRCGKRTYTGGACRAQRDRSPSSARPGGGALARSCGTKDRANIPLAKELAAGIPSAELRLVPGATHLWNLQQPEVFNDTVATFIDRVALPPP